MNCPLQRFKKCPKHNEDGGCAWWLSYSTTNETGNNDIKGCSMTLTPLLLIENANGLGVVAAEVNKCAAEMSASRVENICENEATRQQFVHLAQGHKELIRANHTSTMKGIKA